MNPLWLLLPLALLLLAALDVRLRTVRYTVRSPKLASPVRLAVVSDLHDTRWGKREGVLMRALTRAAPDAVLLPGDFFSDGDASPHSEALLSQIAPAWPAFWVRGNHESNHVHSSLLQKTMAAHGVTALAGCAGMLTVRGTAIGVGGADDPAAADAACTGRQIAAARAAIPPEDFAVLLCHRPDLVSLYEGSGFDLVVCGHAHGGQWRVPGILNGVYAPNQEIPPRYAGGEYRLGGTTMIVSRGLTRHAYGIPRLFNRPELVVIDLLPAEKTDLQPRSSSDRDS